MFLDFFFFLLFNVTKLFDSIFSCHHLHFTIILLLFAFYIYQFHSFILPISNTKMGKFLFSMYENLQKSALTTKMRKHKFFYHFIVQIPDSPCPLQYINSFFVYT